MANDLLRRAIQPMHANQLMLISVLSKCVDFSEWVQMQSFVPMGVWTDKPMVLGQIHWFHIQILWNTIFYCVWRYLNFLHCLLEVFGIHRVFWWAKYFSFHAQWCFFDVLSLQNDCEFQIANWTFSDAFSKKYVLFWVILWIKMQSSVTM